MHQHLTCKYQEIAGSLDYAFVGSSLSLIPKPDFDSDKGTSENMTWKQSLTLLAGLKEWNETFKRVVCYVQLEK